MLKIATIAIKLGTPTYLDNAVKAAIKIAKEYDTIVLMAFNGIKLSITKADQIEDILAFYDSEWAKKPEAKTYEEKHKPQ